MVCEFCSGLAQRDETHIGSRLFLYEGSLRQQCLVRDSACQGYQQDNVGLEGFMRFRLQSEFMLVVFRMGLYV